MGAKKTKVLLGKVGLDGHDRGIRLLSAWFRNAGMEVVYIGTHNTPKSAVVTASEEDVDVIGLSFQGGDHLPLLEAVIEEMKQAGLNDVLLVIGGNIPQQDISALKVMGVDAVFPPGTSMRAIVDHIQQNVKQRR